MSVYLIPDLEKPSLEDTHRAKEIYLRGMKLHYDDRLDPRLGLLGYNHRLEYVTEAYGNSLIPTKYFRKLRRSGFLSFITGIAIGLAIMTIAPVNCLP